MTTDNAEKAEAHETFAQLISAVEVLEKELRIALAVYQVGANVDGGRMGAFGALGTVCAFLEAFDDFRSAGLSIPLRGLQIALWDAIQGARPRMLEPAKLDHRPPGTTERKMLWALAAVTMELLMRSGLSKDVAASQVASAFNNAGYRLPGRKDKSITARTVARWRERATGGLPKTDLETARYRNLLARLPNEGAEAESAARRLLEVLPDFVKPENPHS